MVVQHSFPLGHGLEVSKSSRNPGGGKGVHPHRLTKCTEPPGAVPVADFILHNTLDSGREVTHQGPHISNCIE